MNTGSYAVTHPPIDVDESIISKWQTLIDLAAGIIGIPTGLIMRVKDDDIEVFIFSRTDGNPYKVGDKEHLVGSGLYCEHVIRTRDSLHVPFAPEDPEWKDNPDIALNMNSYLGYPLIMPSGEVFGTICVLDKSERQFDDQTTRLMEQFRDLVESHLALDSAKSLLEEQDRQVRADIGLAHAYQKNFSPEVFSHGRFEAVSVYEPNFHLSGDFFSPFSLSDDKFGLVIGDVSSKGLSAALRAIAILTLCRNSADESISPEQMLSKLNQMFLNQEIELSRFCTMIYLNADSATGDVSYARAGHELPLWYHAASQEVTMLEEGGVPVGLVEGHQYQSRAIRLEPGDRLLIYSDGLTEASNQAGEMLGMDRLKQLMED